MAVMTDYKETLDEYWRTFDTADFVSQDPVQVPRQMMMRADASVADIEITAMWTAMIAWGRREQILKDAARLLDLCGNRPADFIRLQKFDVLPDDLSVHRTLKGREFKQVCRNMYDFYHENFSMQSFLKRFENVYCIDDLLQRLCNMFEPAGLGNPRRHSACKRVNMLLRWMVRKDDIDLGLWRTLLITPANLYAVLDTHVAQQARHMGLITVSRESWNAVLELTDVYRSWDCEDPLKYDMVLMRLHLDKSVTSSDQS